MMGTATQRQKFTAETARQFEGMSTASMMILSVEAKRRGCHCQPYEDWFTFNRWLAQGRVVKKGEHGVKLSIFIPVTTKDEDGEAKETGKRPWTTTVFCRCQTQPKEAKR